MNMYGILDTILREYPHRAGEPILFAIRIARKPYDQNGIIVAFPGMKAGDESIQVTVRPDDEVSPEAVQPVACSRLPLKWTDAAQFTGNLVADLNAFEKHYGLRLVPGEAGMEGLLLVEQDPDPEPLFLGRVPGSWMPERRKK